MKDMEDAPPLPHPAGQRSRAKSSTASSSRSPNSDHRQTSTGEHKRWLDSRTLADNDKNTRGNLPDDLP
jgi:hypothetical protein